MKKHGIYNAKLLEAIAKMGHGDMILIGDVGCAMPQHDQTEIIDLAVCEGVPKVCEVLRAVLSELVVEGYVISQETKDVSPAKYAEFREILSAEKNNGNDLYEKVISYAEMKNLWRCGPLDGQQMKVFVRTGERCPHGYIALVAGVDF